MLSRCILIILRPSTIRSDKALLALITCASLELHHRDIETSKLMLTLQRRCFDVHMLTTTAAQQQQQQQQQQQPAFNPFAAAAAAKAAAPQLNPFATAYKPQANTAAAASSGNSSSGSGNNPFVKQEPAAAAASDGVQIKSEFGAKGSANDAMDI
jgi:hypothetical protein